MSVRHRQLEIELGIELNDIKYSKVEELVAAGVGETSAVEFKLAPPLKAGTGGSPLAEHDPSKRLSRIFSQRDHKIADSVSRLRSILE